MIAAPSGGSTILRLPEFCFTVNKEEIPLKIPGLYLSVKNQICDIFAYCTKS